MAKNPDHFDAKIHNDTNKNEPLVEVVVAGEYEWIDRSRKNTTHKVIDNQHLTTMRLLPDLLKNIIINSEVEYRKWFVGIKSGWKVKEFKKVRFNCEPPFCFSERKQRTEGPGGQGREGEKELE